MASISSSVGTKGTNEVHDVAMVQLMLAALKSSKSAAYFTGRYTNPLSPDTTRAISAFQTDKKLTGGEGSTEMPGLVAPGGATWNTLNGAFTALYHVGTAKDIWKQDPNHHISKGDLFAALQAKLKIDPKFSLDGFFGRQALTKSTLKESDVGNEEIRAVQRLLKAEFDAAATKWREWKPVYYPGKDRRAKNPTPH
jgi:hypothetical protein